MRPAVLTAIFVIAISVPFALVQLVQAGPPPAEPPPEPAQDLVPAGESFWLSLELVGPRGAQIDAARALPLPKPWNSVRIPHEIARLP